MKGKMNGMHVWLVIALAMASTAFAGCSPAAPTPTPTTKAAGITKPAVMPTASPTQVPQPTTAPAKKLGFPESGRTITFVVGFGAGGGLDLSARLLASYLEKEVGVPIAVVNKVGAAGQVGATEVANAKPDGYTVGFNNITPVSMAYLDPQRKGAYTRKDLQPVATYSAESIVLMVKGDSPYRDLKGLVDAARAKPETVKVATAGLRADSHMSYVLLERAADAKFALVNFDSGPLATNALLGGHVDGAFVSISVFAPHGRSGAARALAVLDSKESQFTPGVKTAESQGYKVLVAADHFLFVPASTAREIVDFLDTAVRKTTDAKGHVEQLATIQTSLKYMSARETAAYWEQQEAQLKTFLDLID